MAPPEATLVSNWYFDRKLLKRTPSAVEGMDADRENRYRREGARFIIKIGTTMGLRYDTMATGVVYFHRFYMMHSFKAFPRYVVACSCLFLAGKVEETPKKCKDIIKIAKSLLDVQQFSQFGDDPKEEVMTVERILLQTIKFDLQVDHPYSYLLKYAKSLKGDKNKLQRMVQMAWTFINDSLCTTLCLQFEPEIIAIALMYLAGKLSKFEVFDWVDRKPKQRHWWEMYVEGATISLLEDICHQVLDLYSGQQHSSLLSSSDLNKDSPPATPPSKTSRKMSRPSSPTGNITPPLKIQVVEPQVGQPIPRLEPGEVKQKILSDAKKMAAKPKVKIEGEAIQTITTSPKFIKVEIRPPSPATPEIKVRKHDAPIAKSAPVHHMPVYSTPVATAPPPPPDSSVVPKPPLPPAAASATTYVAAQPLLTSTYTQPMSYYPPVVTAPMPNIQQPPPPPQIPYSPMQPPPTYQHMPPPMPPQQPPSNQYQSSSVASNPYQSPLVSSNQYQSPSVAASSQYQSSAVPPPPFNPRQPPPVYGLSTSAPPRSPECSYSDYSQPQDDGSSYYEYESGYHRSEYREQDSGYTHDYDEPDQGYSQDDQGYQQQDMDYEQDYDQRYQEFDRGDSYQKQSVYRGALLPSPQRYSGPPRHGPQQTGSATGIAPVRITGSFFD